MAFALQIGKPCNICGSTDFVPGFNGRMLGNRPPKCNGCSSMERHRALRDIYDSLPREFMATTQCIQFSGDTSVDRAWFGSHIVSEYGGANSHDLMDIGLADDSYDWVICNHVLEHIPDDLKAVQELLRICKPMGLVQLSFPMPHWLPATRDWGYPDSNDHGHFRYYGADVVDSLLKNSGASGCLVVVGADPTTGAREHAYFLFKDIRSMTGMTQTLIKTHPVVPIAF